MKFEHCPSCDVEATVAPTNDGTHRYVPIVKRPVGAKRPCPVCGGPLCMNRHPAWPMEQPAPECDLWFGHEKPSNEAPDGGLHRDMMLVPTRQDLIWGVGDATWRRGRYERTTTMRGKIDRLSMYHDLHFVEESGAEVELPKMLPDGLRDGLEGEITITVVFEEKDSDRRDR